MNKEGKNTFIYSDRFRHLMCADAMMRSPASCQTWNSCTYNRFNYNILALIPYFLFENVYTVMVFSIFRKALTAKIPSIFSRSFLFSFSMSICVGTVWRSMRADSINRGQTLHIISITIIKLKPRIKMHDILQGWCRPC